MLCQCPDQVVLSKLQIDFWPEPSWKFPYSASAALFLCLTRECIEHSQMGLSPSRAHGAQMNQVEGEWAESVRERLSYKVKPHLKIGVTEGRRIFLDHYTRKRDVSFLCWWIPSHCMNKQYCHDWFRISHLRWDPGELWQNPLSEDPGSSPHTTLDNCSDPDSSIVCASVSRRK